MAEKSTRQRVQLFATPFIFISMESWDFFILFCSCSPFFCIGDFFLLPPPIVRCKQKVRENLRQEKKYEVNFFFIMMTRFFLLEKEGKGSATHMKFIPRQDIIRYNGFFLIIRITIPRDKESFAFFNHRDSDK